MYKSPIDIIEKQMRMEFDDGIWKTVQDYAVSVDKEELIKALRYDRDQYEKGYADGKVAAIDELVRCKDCKHYRDWGDCTTCMKWTVDYDVLTEPNAFCSYGEPEDKK